jgi:hypothetical protein
VFLQSRRKNCSAHQAINTMRDLLFQRTTKMRKDLFNGYFSITTSSRHLIGSNLFWDLNKVRSKIICEKMAFDFGNLALIRGGKSIANQNQSTNETIGKNWPELSGHRLPSNTSMGIQA